MIKLKSKTSHGQLSKGTYTTKQSALGGLGKEEVQADLRSSLEEPVGKKIVCSRLRAKNEERSSKVAVSLAPRTAHLLAEEGLVERHY